MPKFQTAVLIIAIIVLLPTTAHAGSSTSDSVAQVGNYKGGYSYTFTDDPLTAGGYDNQLAVIRVRSNLRSGLLIRPRLHFVQELVKSMESL